MRKENDYIKDKEYLKVETVHTPNVFINPQMPASPKRASFNIKYVFIFLGIVIVAEVIFGLKTLLSPAKPALEVSQPTVNTAVNQPPDPQASARMMLESSKVEYGLGEDIPVTIKLDTLGKVADGVDAVIKFDPKVLDATGSSVSKGTIFPDYPVAKVTPDGTVRITAITSLQGQGFTGSGVLATINFKGKKTGSTPIIWEFFPGATNDSNIFGSSSEGDMLKEVGGLEVTIK